MKTHQFKITANMRKIKEELPSYRDGGLTWQEFAYIGLLESRNRYKFGRENELFELVKDLKE